MKKMLFVHDHIFSSNAEGKIYSAAAYPSSNWERYLLHFDEVTVVGRYAGVKDNPEKSLVLSSHEKVSFVFLPDVREAKKFLFRRKEVKSKIYSLVEESDAVVVRLPSENGLIAFSIAKYLNKPLGVEAVGCAFDAFWNHGSIFAKLYAPLAFFRMRKAIKKSNRTLYVTNSFLQNRYPSSANALTVIASNVEIHIPENKQFCREDRSDKTIIIGLIGNYKTKYKGVHLAIKALSEVKDQVGSFQLKILGKGNKEEYIELANDLGIGDNVIFCGSLPNGDLVMQWLDQVDIYIQPSLTEGLPRALIEAMSRGCVCIGSDVGGIPQLLEEDFIHKSGDWKELSSVILKAINSKSDWHEISIRNYNEAKKYDFEIVNAARYKFYSSLNDGGF